MSENTEKEKSNSLNTVKSFKTDSMSKESDNTKNSGVATAAYSGFDSDQISLKSNENSIAVTPTSIPGMSSQSDGQTASPYGAQTMASTQPIRQITQMQNMTVMPISTVFGPYPVLAYCPRCNADSLTVTKNKAGNTLIISLISCCIGTTFCFCCCCLSFIPSLIEEFYDVEHLCRNCDNLIGIYKRPCC